MLPGWTHRRISEGKRVVILRGFFWGTPEGTLGGTPWVLVKLLKKYPDKLVENFPLEISEELPTKLLKERVSAEKNVKYLVVV